MLNVKIKGYGTYVPENYVMFGAHKRHRSTENETQLYMGVVSAKRALENANLSINDIDCIVSASAIPIQPIPCNAALYHEQLAKGTDIPALDIGTTCTSFLTALDIMSHMIEIGKYKNVLIISSEIASAGLNNKEKESYELFADGAVSMVLSKSNGESGIIYSDQRTWSEGAHMTEIKSGGSACPAYNYTPDSKSDYLFHMEGIKILRLAASKLPQMIDNINNSGIISMDEIDVVVPHQASKALNTIIKRLKIPENKFVNIVKEYGNMVSASVPFAFCYGVEEGFIKSGDKVALLGTAAGFTVNSVVLKY